MSRRPLPFLEQRFLPAADCDDEHHARMIRALRRIMAERLSSKQRQAVELYYMQGLTVRAIAGMRGVAPSTVSRTLRRAEARMRRYLEYI